jgi:hypothetical protein
MKQSKTTRLVEYLKRYRKIEPKTAWEKFGIYRLSAVIFNLRYRYGWVITTEMTTAKNGDEYAVYRVVEALKEPQR